MKVKCLKVRNVSLKVSIVILNTVRGLLLKYISLGFNVLKWLLVIFTLARYLSNPLFDTFITSYLISFEFITLSYFH